jgi:hypothetical protein
MLRRALISASLGLLIVAGWALLHNAPPTRAQTNQNSGSCCGPDNPVAPREIDFPYYSLKDGFGSTLNLVSDSPQNLDLSIAVRSTAGETLLT